MAAGSDHRSEVQGLPYLWAILGGVIVIGSLLRFYGIASWDLRGDEVFTYVRSATNPDARGLFSLYYQLCHQLIGVFDNEILAVRLPAALAGALSLVAFFFFAREAAGMVTAVMATTLLAFSHQQVELSQFARYYSIVFLFATLHFWFVLRFLRTGHLSQFVVAVLSGLIASLAHPPAAVVFVVTGIYLLLGLRFQSLIPVPRIFVLAIGALGLICVYLAFPTHMIDAWVGFHRWDNSPWAMIPLLAFNNYTLPVFAAAILGLGWLAWREDTRVAVMAILGVGLACVLLFAANFFMNFAPRYVTALAPWFLLSAGALCAAPARSSDPARLAGAIAATLILVAAQLPSLASFFLEKRNISPELALEQVMTQSTPQDVLEGNVRSPFLNPDHFRPSTWRGEPSDAGVAWKEHLDGYLASPVTVWFVNLLPRSGYAPEYEAWLLEHAERIHVQRSRRLDRREVTLDVWRFDPPSQKTALRESAERASD